MQYSNLVVVVVYIMKIRTDIKDALKESKKSSADLSREIGLNYEILNRYLNGRARMPENVENAISEKLKEWND